MKVFSQQLRLSATDLSNHLACRHLITLELSVARGKRAAPEWSAPNLDVIRELGLRYEERYLAFPQQEGREVLHLGSVKDEARAAEETQRAMELGAEIIAPGSAHLFDVVRSTRCAAKGAETEQIWGLVVRGIRLQIGTRNKSDDDRRAAIGSRLCEVTYLQQGVCDS